jgi:PAS domain S-box-containing protein
MPQIAPSYRAAVAALIVATVGIMLVGVLHGRTLRSAEDRHARAGAAATARAAAAALALAPRREASSVLVGAHAGDPDAPLLALIGTEGTVVASAGQLPAGSLRWEMLRARVPPAEVTIGGRRYLVVVVAAPGDTRLAAMAPASGRGLMRSLLVLWLVVGVVVAAGAWYAGPYAAQRLGSLAARLASPDGPTGQDRRALVDSAARSLGPFASPLDAVADAADRARDQLAETRTTVAALLQINPHYVLVCTLDGQILDANPAFYAVTGLPFEGVRGNRIEVLNDVMPIEPLFELARRSLREGSSISGIEYALINRDDQRRPVIVSLRALNVGGQPAVVIQATDVANQRTLEHQIAQFSDALDLMVDQRVAQITGGHAGLEGLLDAAGVVIAEFDAGGGARRLSRAAEDLIAGRIVHVPHVTAFASRLELPPSDRERFVRWAMGDGTSLLRTPILAGGVRREMVWRRGLAEGAGTHGRRHVLVGFELPPSPPTAAGDGASAEAALGRPA